MGHVTQETMASQQDNVGRNLTEEERMERAEKLWSKLMKELSVLEDNNYTARKLFDYIERLYA